MKNEERHVREMYFISPEYKDKFTNIEDYTDSDGERCCRGTKYDDKKDTFPAWIRKNTIVKKIEQRNDGEDLSGLAELMGENGAFCQISHKKFYENPKYFFPLGNFGEYTRIIKILITPSSKNLPIELDEALKSRDYKMSSKQDKNVQKLIDSSRMF